ncbi:MAG: hypothetical protein IJO52_05305 [Clostridia bacterium]|nr:hypothetical protein [Clostridia bacterium]
MNYLDIVLWSLGIGMCLCNFYIYYNRIIHGGFIRSLIGHEAFSPEAAASLPEAGCDKSIFLKKALKSKSNTIYGVVTECDGKYYISEEKRNKAEKMFVKKGTSLWMTIVACIGILAVTYAATLIVPYIVEATKNVF